MVAISRSKKLSPLVKTLRIGSELFTFNCVSPEGFHAAIFDPQVFQQFPGYFYRFYISDQRYDNMTVHAFPKPHPGAMISMQREEVYSLYRATVGPAIAWRKAARTYDQERQLAEAISKFRNLQCIHLSSKNGSGKGSWGAEIISPYILSMRPHLADRSDCRLRLLYRLVDFMPAFNVEKLVMDNDDARSPVEDRHVRRMYHSSPGSLIWPGNATEFSSLKHLDIPIGPLAPGPGAQINIPRSHITDLLSNLPDLKCLSLRNVEQSKLCDIRPVLDAVCTRSLESLSLQAVLYSADHFGQFLMRHSSTLKKISIDKGYMGYGSWESVFDAMRSSMALGDVTVRSDLVTVSLDDRAVYNDWPQDPQRRIIASVGICDYVTKRIPYFPASLCDDKSVSHSIKDSEIIGFVELRQLADYDPSVEEYYDDYADVN